MIEFLNRAKGFASRVAIRQGSKSYTYQHLLDSSQSLATRLPQDARESQTIAILTAPGFDYVSALWAIWRTGNIAVPLCPDHPLPFMEHMLRDSSCKLLIVDEHNRDKISALGHQLSLKLVAATARIHRQTFVDQMRSRALILYTSGTTSLPKGVVITHSNIKAQLNSLSEAWHWDKNDYILNVLPLHHVHGIVNVLCCALWNGASCELLPKFEPALVYNKFLEGRVNLFMAVPTIYFKLIEYWQSLEASEQTNISTCLQNFRLMVSGSAALPEEILKKWEVISGHTLLERYGMTEIGMALSNPYSKPRHAGHVGFPLPGVEVTLMEGHKEVPAGEPGEIWVKGAGVFHEYWGLPEATRKSFHQGWFKTGDIAKKTARGYKILGRNSVDIIKSGGYKISALEIEDVLLSHPQVKECAVVGIPDLQWGEVITAALVGEPLPTQQQLDHLVTSQLPAYKKPRKYFFLKNLPRNSMGKLVKPKLKELLMKLDADHRNDHIS